MEDEANIEDSYEIVEFKDCQNSAGEMSTEEAGTSRNPVTSISAAGVNTQATNNDWKQSPNVGESESGAEGSSYAVENEKTEGNKGFLRKNGQPANVPGGKPVSENIQESIAGNINKGSLKKDGQPDESGGTPVSENIQGIPGDINKGPLRQDGQAVSHSFGIGTSESGNRQNFQGDKQGRSSPEDDTGSDADKYYPPGNKGEKALKDTGAIPKTKSSSASFEEAWKRFSLKIKTRSSPEINHDASRELEPIKMQYLLQSSSQKIETTLKLEMKKENFKMKKFSYDKEFLTIELAEITQNHEKNIQDKIILCLQDEINQVSLKSLSCSCVESPDVVLKDSLEKGELGLYRDREKIFIVGISKDLKQIVQMLTQSKAKETGTKDCSPEEYKFESVVAMKIMRDLGLEDQLKNDFPSIALRFDNERSVAVFEGYSSLMINPAIDKFKKSIKRKEHGNDSMLIELLELPEIKNKVDSLIREKQLLLSWNTSKANCKFTIYYREEPLLTHFDDMLKQMTMTLHLPIISDNKECLFSTTKAFVDFVDQHKGKNMVIGKEGNNFHLLATKDVIGRLLLLEETFQNQSTKTAQNQSTTTAQNQSPTTCQIQSPTAVQNQSTAMSQTQSPTTDQNQLTSTIQNLSTTSQIQSSTTFQNQSTSTSQTQSPTTSQNQPPTTSQNQPPTTSQNQPPTTMQEKIPYKKISIPSPSEISTAKASKKVKEMGPGLHDKISVYKVRNAWDLHRLNIWRKFSFKLQCPQIELLEDKIRYSGSEDQLWEEIQNFIAQYMLKSKIEDFPIAVYEFYETDFIKQVVDSSLGNITCYWFVDCIGGKEKTIQVYAADESSLSIAVATIIKCVSYREYSSTEDCNKVLSNPEVDFLLKTNNQKIMLVDELCDEFMVVGLSQLVEQFDQLFEEIRMSKLVTHNTKYSLGIHSTVLKYIQKFKQAELDEFLSYFKVNIIEENEEVFVLGNFKNAESAAKKFLETKYKAQKWCCEVSNPVLILEQLKPTIQQLQDKYQCFLEVKSDAKRINQQQLAQWINWTNHQHLVLVHGCVCEMSADVIVCPSTDTYATTKIGNSIIEKGGHFVNEDFTQKRVSQDVPVYISSETGDLSCIMVAHTAVPKSTEGDMKKIMVSFLQELLSNVDKTTQLQSIVIPTMVGDRIPEPTLIHWFIEAFKGIQNKLSNLKQIYLCSEDANNAENAVEVLSKGLVGENVSFYDFRHMFEHRQNSLPREIKPARICVSLVNGNLIDQKVDVIVNSCGTDLNMNNGIISALILKAAGPSIAKECLKLHPHGIDYGVVVTTSAGKLKCKLICHGALPKWIPGTCFSSKILEKLVFDCLLMAEAGKCKTIAFPVFGTGTLLYPWDTVAETMIEAVHKFSRIHYDTVVQEVRIVLYEKDVKSIEAFSSRKLRMEKVHIIEEDPKPTPSLILESRCNNVRIRVVSQSELRFHHCEAQVVICSFAQTMQEDPNSMLRVKGIEFDKSSGINYWRIKVFSDEQEKTFQDAIRKVFMFLEEQRLSSVAICLMHERDVPVLPLKKQITLVKNYVSNLGKIRYLQLVKLVILDREKFDTMIAETRSKQEAESKQWSYASIVAGLFSHQKTQWKIMRYCNTTEIPRLLVHVAGIEVKSIQDMLHELVQKVESVVKKDNNYFGGSIKHNADLETDKHNIWVRTEKQPTGLKIIPLPEFMFNQLDDAVKSGSQSVEISDEKNLYVFNFDNFKYFIDDMFNGTSGMFYKIGGSGDTSQASDATKEQKKEKLKRQTSEDEVFGVIYGDVSKTLLKHDDINKLAKLVHEKFLEVEIMSITTGTLTFKFKTVKLLQDVNQFLKMKYKISEDCLLKSESQPTAPPRKKNISSSSDGSLSPSNLEIKVKMTKEQFEKVNFFLKEKILHSKLTYDGNQLILKVNSPKDYKKYEEIITPEIANVDQMPQVDIPMENELKMEDIHFMTTDFSSIFCRIVGNVVQLSGPSYDKLMQAKHRIEIVMGSKQETKGRRGRRFADPVDQYKRDSNSSDMHSDAASQSKSQSYSPSSATAISMMQVYTTTEGITVKVYNGNILKLDVDCIVNAANESLSHGGGVAAVISGAAGYQFDQESKDYIQLKGNLAVGECCSTSAGNLKYRNVIHAVGPRWNDYKYDQKKICAYDLKQSIIHSFQEAERLNLRSIAIPSISAGIFGVPKAVCVAEYGNAVTEFSKSRKSGTCLKEIHFVDKDLGLVSLIQNEFDKIFKPLPQQNSGLPAKGSGRHNFQRSVSSGSGNNSFQQGSSLGGSRSINHTAQFEVKNCLRIYVKIGNITKCEVDAIACPQDEFKIHRGAIATEVEKIGGYDYKTQFDRLYLTKYGSIRMLAPSNCPWKYVIQTVPPRWNLEATRNNQVFERNLKETVFNILNEAKYGNIKTFAIPLMGIAEKGYDTPVKTFAEQFMKAIFQQFDTRNFTVKEIHIVVHDIATVTTIIDVFSSMENQGVKRLGPPVRRQSEGQGEEPMEVEVYGKEKENCCICLDKLMKPKKLACGHTFCTECIEQHFKFKPSCPQCGAIHGTVTGTQPKGIMTKRTKKYSLPGFHGTDTIEIEYMIYSGIQGEEHPNPGTRFDGITRTAFLPDNRKGRLIARLLEVAFNRRLIFTIGTSTTTGKTGVVTWNDIHHKTNSKPNTQFGYPDEGYFDRVLEELSVKGVTEKDLKD